MGWKQQIGSLEKLQRPSGPGALMDGEEFTFHTPTVYIF